MNRERFFKLLRHSMFMDEFKTIVRMAGELTEHIDAASELADCDRAEFSGLLTDVLFKRISLEEFMEELGIGFMKEDEG